MSWTSSIECYRLANEELSAVAGTRSTPAVRPDQPDLAEGRKGPS